MKIIPLVTIHTRNGLVLPGEEVELKDAEARKMIEDNFALPAAKQSSPAPPPPSAKTEELGKGSAGNAGN